MFQIILVDNQYISAKTIFCIIFIYLLISKNANMIPAWELTYSLKWI